MSRGAVMGMVVLLVAAGGVIWWRQTHRPSPVPPATAPPPVAPPRAPPPPPAPAIQNPVPAAAAPDGLPSLDQSDGYVKKALVDLVGRKPVSAFFRLDGVVHRFVATANNLATDGATADLWPVNPTPGRFETETRDGSTVPSAHNAERYAPFVRFAAEIDAGRAVALYFRLYPLLQRAYEDLGYPGAYLNDLVVAVIDNLLATPNVAGPIRVKRVRPDGGDGRRPGSLSLRRLGPGSGHGRPEDLAANGDREPIEDDGKAHRDPRPDRHRTARTSLVFSASDRTIVHVDHAVVV